MTWLGLLSPPAQVSKTDTGLRFTDILFGFVIRELFLRLQAWADLPWFVRWQLIAGTALVLGSWIGFRRSLNRSEYEVKFFNYPFWRFLFDQLMVILYFRIAVLTPASAPPSTVNPDDLAEQTAKILLFIFTLYAVWDLLGIRMAKIKDESGGWKYSEIDEDKKPTGRQSRRDWPAFWITSGTLIALVSTVFVAERTNVGSRGASWIFAACTALLILYRFVKELKNSWLASRTGPAAQESASGSPA
jgi:hypothetical protein